MNCNLGLENNEELDVFVRAFGQQVLMCTKGEMKLKIKMVSLILQHACRPDGCTMNNVD